MHDDDHGNGDVGKVGSSQGEACIFFIVLWDLPVCLELRKLLTLKYFRLMTAAFKIYHKRAPSEAKRQVNAGIAFIKSGTDIILQELPKYRAASQESHSSMSPSGASVAPGHLKLSFKEVQAGRDCLLFPS